MKMYFFVLIALILGCNPDKTSIDFFLSEVDSRLSKSDKEEIKKCHDVGCLTLFVASKAPKQFRESFKSIPDDVSKLLSDSIKSKKVYDQQRALILAYQKKLNNQAINLSKIRDEIIEFDKLEEERYIAIYRSEAQVKSEIAENNYNGYNVGDTLRLLLPLERSGNIKVVYFYNSYNQDNFKDTLFLTCILLNKGIEKSDSKLVPDEFYFSVKILKGVNKEIKLVDKKYSKGEIIKLPLYVYGRPIE